jgi:hypothetical protein
MIFQACDWLDKLGRTQDRCAEIKDDTLQMMFGTFSRSVLVHSAGPDFSGGIRPFGDSRRLLHIRHMAVTVYIAYYSWSPLITAALAIHPALSSATRLPSYLLSNHLPCQGSSRFTSGEEIISITARNSKYSPTLATKCSLLSSPSGICEIIHNIDCNR